jgi:hypothetical protein
MGFSQPASQRIVLVGRRWRCCIGSSRLRWRQTRCSRSPRTRPTRSHSSTHSCTATGSATVFGVACCDVRAHRYDGSADKQTLEILTSLPADRAVP